MGRADAAPPVRLAPPLTLDGAVPAGDLELEAMVPPAPVPLGFPPGGGLPLGGGLPFGGGGGGGLLLQWLLFQ